MNLDKNKKQLIFQAFLASQQKKNNNQSQPYQITEKQQPKDLITQALKNAMKKKSSPPKRVIPLQFEIQKKNASGETQSLQKVARLLSQNARLFAENMAELISLKVQQRIYNNSQ